MTKLSDETAHEWICDGGCYYCKKCMNIKGADSKNYPCKGVLKIHRPYKIEKAKAELET